LIHGHELGMRRVMERLQTPKRAIDLFGALFARAIGPDLVGMATGETLAHLNCLMHRGQVRRETTDGLALYSAIS
jgi:hypothetical protein